MTRFINKKPDRISGVLLAALPFIGLVLAYWIGSEIRLAENPNDKILPGLEAMRVAIERLAFEEDRRTGEYIFWVDTTASLYRLLLGVGIATVIGGIFGVLQGLLPYMNRTFSGFTAVLAMIPPLALLPILFIVFGLGEVSKIVLIIAGVLPFMIRDLAMRAEELPREQIIKAQTLGASTWQILVRIVMPQVLPRMFDAMRLSLGAAWLFLIAAEAIASQSGLGYRIFLMRRYLAMDVIIPYVAWITLLAFTMDYTVRLLQHFWFSWHYKEGRL